MRAAEIVKMEGREIGIPAEVCAVHLQANFGQVARLMNQMSESQHRSTGKKWRGSSIAYRICWHEVSGSVKCA